MLGLVFEVGCCWVIVIVGFVEEEGLCIVVEVLGWIGCVVECEVLVVVDVGVLLRIFGSYGIVVSG